MGEPVYFNPYDIRKRRSGPSAMKAQMADHESYEKETVSHTYNPYDIRQRGIVKAQLEERIESDMQELAALDALELETVSDEQDLDGEGVIEMASSHGQTGNMCSSRFGEYSLLSFRMQRFPICIDWNMLILILLIFE